MCKKSKTVKHEHGESQQVQTSQCLRPTFVITGLTTKTRYPRERAFHDPSAEQQNKTAFGLWQFDYLQTHARSSRCLRRFITALALIHRDQLDAASSHLLHGSCQFPHLGSILLIG